MQVFAIYFLMFAAFAVFSGYFFYFVCRWSNTRGRNLLVVSGVFGCGWAYGMGLSAIVGGILGVAGSIVGICVILFLDLFFSKRGRF